jgi:hypothetical protein
MTFGIEYTGPGLGQAYKCGGVKLVNGIPRLPNPHCEVSNLSDFRFQDTMLFLVSVSLNHNNF